MTEPKLLTVTQAAARLGVTPARVRYLIGRGRLPATRIGARVWVIRAEDVEAFERRKPGRKRGVCA